MDNNIEFLNAYNRLDNYLQSIVNIPPKVNLISYLERVLPEKQSAECKTIREFKNVIESHGVNPGAVKPTVPKEWIKWLNKILSYCKKNSVEIAKKVQKVYDSSQNPNTDKGKHSSSTNVSSYHNYFTSMYGYNHQSTTNNNSSPSSARQLSEFAGLLKIYLRMDGSWPAGTYASIVYVAEQIVRSYSKGEFEQKAKEYGFRYNIDSTVDKIGQLAEYMVASLPDDEINYLLKGRWD